MYKMIIQELDVNQVLENFDDIKKETNKITDKFGLGASDWDWDTSYIEKYNDKLEKWIVIGELVYNGKVFDLEFGDQEITK